MEQELKHTSTERKKSCVNCGAELLYQPGTTEIHCEYCNHTETITPAQQGFQELELAPYLAQMGGSAYSEAIQMLECKNCGATQHVEEHYKSLHCVYCASPLILEEAVTEDWIVPGALVPFQLDQQKSHTIFSKWVKGLWFAPNKLKKASLNPEQTKGLYLPYWTFDAQLYGNYRGERGTYYYVDVPYTTQVNGKTVHKTRRERRTRWSSTSGSIQGFVDDTLVQASRSKKHAIPAKVAHWNLKKLTAFDTSYLAGFVTEKYTVSLQEGHLNAQNEAERIARSWAKHDIGGDAQRVHSVDIRLSEETFKHILLPIYISSYAYQGKQYQFFVNGQTGTISGKRPYSYWKIGLLIVSIILFICGVLYWRELQ